jgi:hypothetical protein
MKSCVFLAGLVCTAAWLFFGCASAESLVQKGRESSSLADAEKYYQEALEREPENAAIRETVNAELSKRYFDAGKASSSLAGAEKYYAQALERDPGSAELKKSINADLFRRYLPVIKNGGTEGDKAYEKAVAIDPDNADMYYNRGYDFYVKRGNHAAVPEFWLKALEINPSYSSSDFNIPPAMVLNIGLRNLKNNLSLKNASLYFMLGIAYHDIVKHKKVSDSEFGGYYEKAADAFKKGYDIDIVQGKNNTQDVKAAYLVFIADVLAKSWNFKEAIDYYRELYNARDITYDKSGVAGILNLLTQISGGKIFETRISGAGAARKITITGYSGWETNVAIPEKIDGIPVTAIGERAFAQKEILIVALPPTVTTIGKGAFAGNSMELIGIGTNVSLEADSFDNQFASVYNQRKKAGGMYRLQKNEWKNLADDFAAKVSKEGNKETAAIVAYKGEKDLVIIPPYIGGLPVTEIAALPIVGGFTGIKRLSLPHTLIKIGGQSFGWNELSSIIVPDSVREIETKAFSKMTGEIRDITIGAHVNIADDAFGVLNSFAADYNKAGKRAGRYIGKAVGARKSVLVENVVYSLVTPAAAPAAETKKQETANKKPPPPERKPLEPDDLSFMIDGEGASRRVVIVDFKNFKEKPFTETLDEVIHRIVPKFIIPDKINGVPVTTIAKGAFKNKILAETNHIVIPASVKFIYEEAFADQVQESLVYPMFKTKYPDRSVLIITIGANVEMADNAFAFNFGRAYKANGKKGGVYTYLQDKWQFAAQ